MIYSSELIPRAIQTLFWDRHTISQTVPTLLQDRHTISAKQQLMPSKSTHDPTTNLGCSDTTCCAPGNNRWGIYQLKIDAAGDVPARQEYRNNRESKSTQYLTRFGNFPTSSGQERDFIDVTINTSKYQRNTLRIFRDTIMRALAHIYSHRVPGI